MAENLDLWYGWIPTNRGKINFSFISEKNLRTIAPKQIFSFEKTKNQIDIKSLEISATSDSSNFNKYKKNTNKNIVELMTYTDVELRNNENLISGNIKVRNDEKSFSNESYTFVLIFVDDVTALAKASLSISNKSAT